MPACQITRSGHPGCMSLKRIAFALAVISTTLTFAASAASAHAPIEWSDPGNDAVVEKIPEKITMRFEEEPVRLSMHTLELAPRTTISLTARKVGERTYEVPLPKEVVAREDGTLVIFLAIHSKDGHDEAGVYLLHVRSATTTTQAKPAATTAPRVVGPLGTTPTAVFTPPARDNTVELPAWVVISALSGVAVLLGVTLHRARSKRQSP